MHILRRCIQIAGSELQRVIEVGSARHLLLAHQIATGIQETLAADLLPLARLRLLLVRSLELLDTDPGYRGIIARLIRADSGPEPAQGMAAKTAGMRQLHATLTDLIRAGIADGSVYPEVDPELAALAAVGLLNGVILTWLLVPETFKPQTQASALVDLFLRSLTQEPRTYEQMSG